MPVPIPENEADRVSALHAMAVLDTPPESDFDDIVQIASEICAAPISLVTMVDTDRWWFKAQCGSIGVSEAPREIAFCSYAIMGRDLMVIPDITADGRFADNPIVRGDPRFRFYAGAPILTSEGAALGTLCVLDYKPHRLDIEQMRALRILAGEVTELLELRRQALTGTLDPPPELRTLDLAYITGDRIHHLRAIGDDRKTAITLAPTDPAWVRADPVRLDQAVDYVSFTALKATPAGGRVAVRVATSPSPTIEIRQAAGSGPPKWWADLCGTGTSDEPVPHAVADILRAHGATKASTSVIPGSTDVRIALQFPPA
ncbi:GAF domain-containing protein [Dactylosporangium sp. McL0621]|uniref:sensor histidine kinase n=1 Tax=Dactylosporangium sp. McL0621 TaxID=3415678 RepID=UPI003CEC6221